MDNWTKIWKVKLKKSRGKKSQKAEKKVEAFFKYLMIQITVSTEKEQEKEDRNLRNNIRKILIIGRLAFRFL